MSTYTKILIFLAILILAGNSLYLSLAFGAGLQATFSGEKLRNHKMLQLVVDETVKNVQSKALEILPASSFTPGDKTSEIFERYFQNIKTPDLFRLKVWDRNYMVIWSNSKELTGTTLPDNNGVKDALEGKIEVEVERTSEHFTERAYANYVEIYIPVKDKSGEIVGVVETYKVIENIVYQLRNEFYRAAATSLAISFVIFISSVFILRRFVSR